MSKPAANEWEQVDAVEAAKAAEAAEAMGAAKAAESTAQRVLDEQNAIRVLKYGAQTHSDLHIDRDDPLVFYFPTYGARPGKVFIGDNEMHVVLLRKNADGVVIGEVRPAFWTGEYRLLEMFRAFTENGAAAANAETFEKPKCLADLEAKYEAEQRAAE